ncbi:MAG: DsbA family oxidoreductase [Chitinophagaceae bacterium]|nr:MAG: DsbA family oxidoreductase [Chitinophagaceae bacterium]
MKVEIWSDVMCPFCYIGKRRFESGLAEFEGRKDIEVEWKSFQLNPGMKTEPGKSINQYLSEVKGWSPEEARQMNDRVTGMAAAEGLHYDLDKAVVANSFDAHRLLQFAKTNGLGDQLEELLFRSYFTAGGNIADHGTLLELALEAGLDREATAAVLAGDAYSDNVQQDIYEAGQIGVRGVPYFVFNDRYAVSGAQGADTFRGALEKSWGEWKSENKQPELLEGSAGEACGPEGNCS